MRFGVHLPTAGRLAAAPERALEIGCQALQVFSSNPRGWAVPALDPANVNAFSAAVARAQLSPVVVHATYLINLAAPDARIYRLSVAAFLAELQRAAALGASCYVVHCGSHKGTGEAAGRARIREALHRAVGELAHVPMVLLENTAGTANSLGTTFEDLAILLEGMPGSRVGVCFDTCHALAAGYEVRTAAGVAETLNRFDRVLSLARLRCLHINDSKGDLNSHLDRHEHIGAGAIGDAGFRAFFSDRRLWELPAILETPLKKPEDDRRNLRRAVQLACAAGAVAEAVLRAMPRAPAGRRRTPRTAAKRPALKVVILRPPALAKHRPGK